MKEIVTLQFGSTANAIGAHYWNAQEFYFNEEDPVVEHDRSFRIGQGSHQEDTYTPRLLLYDLPDGLGSMDKISALYESEQLDEAQENWTGKYDNVRTSTRAKALYQQNLEKSDINYWPDYNRLYYHPRSIVQLPQYQYGNEYDSFDLHQKGRLLFEQMESGEEVVDNHLRWHLEDCDSLQGFQIAASTFDAWAGFASGYLDAIRDSLPKTTVVFSALDEFASSEERSRYSSNTVSSLYDLGRNSDIYLPVGKPDPALCPSQLDQKNFWELSAFYSIALENMFLPSRMKERHGDYSLVDFASLLNKNGHESLAFLSLQYGRQETKNANFYDSVVGDRKEAHIEVTRGYAADELKYEKHWESINLHRPALASPTSLPDYLRQGIDPISTSLHSGHQAHQYLNQCSKVASLMRDSETFDKAEVLEYFQERIQNFHDMDD